MTSCERHWFAISIAFVLLAPIGVSAEIIDYHQHLYSPEAGACTSVGPKGIDARSLVAELDAAGIQRAVVLSVAYSLRTQTNLRFQMNTSM